MSVIQHAIRNVGVRPFGIVAHLLREFPHLCFRVDSEGNTTFDTAFEVKDAEVLSMLFVAAVDERCAPLLRGCFVPSVLRVLLEYPEATEGLGPAVQRIPLLDTSFSPSAVGSGKQVTHARMNNPVFCGHDHMCRVSAEDVWRGRGANGTSWEEL